MLSELRIRYSSPRHARKRFVRGAASGSETVHVKGYLSRFYNETPQPFLPGKPSSGPKTALPHWEICRPDIRRDLERGDMVFFFSAGETITGWSDCACRGVIIVSANATEAEAERALGRDWGRWHRSQRCSHHKSTRYNRANDIILGDGRKSLWASRGIDLHGSDFDRLRKAGKLGKQRNLWLNRRECLSLYRTLRSLVVST